MTEARTPPDDADTRRLTSASPADATTSSAGAGGRRRPGSPADPAARPDDERPLLPDVTADERDVGWGDPYERDDDERFLRDVPPHHGS